MSLLCLSYDTKRNEPRGFRIRENHNVQSSIFDIYSHHPFRQELKEPSGLLDSFASLLELIERNIRNPDTTETGANGVKCREYLSVSLGEQILSNQLRELSFYLSDSMIYRTFAGLKLIVTRVVPDFIW